MAVQYFQKVMSQKLNFYNTKYTGMQHLGATLIFKNTVYCFIKNKFQEEDKIMTCMKNNCESFLPQLPCGSLRPRVWL